MSDVELLEVLQKIRDIEQRNPKRDFKIFVDAPDMSRDMVKGIFARISPPLPYTLETAGR
jgi:hypothetical protein